MASTKPGPRKQQILQALANMLEQPKGDKITTAALARRIDVSEATLYRHFASKAQMFEGLIESIESSVFGEIHQIVEREKGGIDQVRALLHMLLGFAAEHPGMTRVLIGDALVGEDERLQLRMNQFHDRVELACTQSLRLAASQGHGAEANVGARASLLVSYVVGRWHRYARSGFRHHPAEGTALHIALLLAACDNA